MARESYVKVSQGTIHELGEDGIIFYDDSGEEIKQSMVADKNEDVVRNYDKSGILRGPPGAIKLMHDYIQKRRTNLEQDERKYLDKQLTKVINESRGNQAMNVGAIYKMLGEEEAAWDSFRLAKQVYTNKAHESGNTDAEERKLMEIAHIANTRAKELDKNHKYSAHPHSKPKNVRTGGFLEKLVDGKATAVTASIFFILIAALAFLGPSITGNVISLSNLLKGKSIIIAIIAIIVIYYFVMKSKMLKRR